MTKNPQLALCNAIRNEDLPAFKEAIKMGGKLFNEIHVKHASTMLGYFSHIQTAVQMAVHYAIRGNYTEILNEIQSQMKIDLGPSIKNSMKEPSDVIEVCSPKIFEFIHDFYHELHGTWHDNFNLINIVAGGNHMLIEPLLVFGGSVNEVDDQGKTPLMYSHSLEASQLLIKLGANLHQVDHNGLTPIAHALMNLCDIYDPEDEGIDDEMGQNLVFLIEQRAIKNDPNCLILSEYLLKTYSEIPKSYIKKIQGFEQIIDQAQEVMAKNRKDKLELFLNSENQVVKQGNLRKIRTKL